MQLGDCHRVRELGGRRNATEKMKMELLICRKSVCQRENTEHTVTENELNSEEQQN